MVLQVYVSDKWKFIYIRQPKSSSSSVLIALTQQLCRGQCKSNELRAVTKLDEKKWEEYFVFTFVRNPWTRLLSAYHMFNGKHLRRCAAPCPCIAPPHLALLLL